MTNFQPAGLTDEDSAWPHTLAKRLGHEAPKHLWTIGDVALGPEMLKDFCISRKISLHSTFLTEAEGKEFLALLQAKSRETEAGS